MDIHLLSYIRSFENSHLAKQLSQETLDIIIKYYIDYYHETLIFEALTHSYAYTVHHPISEETDIVSDMYG